MPTVDETIRITILGGIYSVDNATAAAVAVIETVDIVREMTITGTIVRAVAPPVTGVLLSADTADTTINIQPTLNVSTPIDLTTSTGNSYWFDSSFNLEGAGSAYRVDDTPVVQAQVAGWAAIGGYTFTPNRAVFDNGTITLADLANVVATLINDLGATNGHGLISS